MSASSAHLVDFESQFRLFVVAISLPIACRDVYRSVKIVIHDDPVIYKLNLLQTFLLLVNTVASIPSFFGQSINCTVLSIANFVLHYFSLLTMNVILYLEAYYSSTRTRFVACVCALILAAQTICLALALQGGLFTTSPYGGCKVILTNNWNIGMSVATSILIVFLIGVFIMNLHQLPDMDRNQAYRVMIRHSVIFGIVIYVFDILFLVLEVLGLLDPGITLALNWLIKSRLMTVMMATAYRRRKSHRKISLGAAESATELETKISYGDCQSSDKDLCRMT
ncbi:hypothetical protein K493DRAFT_318827 [Basidiobolus meristosporus CBS 931.73]|uniref:Uncharacterized protein n=1 Tax=Basidiobolus meristosporus CBS 931.73 TaxID=1314790 RepID=A0A1Y1XVG0_9FUNG|nr:hypothetical protein K493DRAFT_318827 [Basidiobolus meristosporus CBS 931.73]|eukprot:ORX89284.1 hypothetical protein K493DRAFT_318827 [Basidiobolus meristosporus CBS 931.73]